ncbi:MAG: succinylglutamate desuccinylase/aspartoacylase family protein [Chelatococcus sp.]|uniref:succinylglutamate desuccinylase/aspartoacylase family protein n=1 Tax=Chelatococcus sp. TaxID=1953771 RepID=UPI0025BD0A6A|nr:succinylglutamate desuccinylase/aspartoacylase family protein [Chelatococcus sp.]MBX3537715.1 succinylglutamate desuccinylase/aspartoacylase family protein [Chelatococcus sp.]
MIEIGTARAKPGMVARGFLRVGRMADASDINLPVSIASGHKPGPTVWLEACIHGDEYGGAAAIMNFMRDLDAAEISGTIIAVPVANPPSYNHRSRFSYIDGQNLNRVFPGSTGGSYSFQLAAVLREHLQKHADYILDLHSGGIGAEVPFYAIYKDNGSAAVERSRELAKLVGCDVIWRAEGGEGLGSTVTSEALRLGVPAVTIECGGGTVTPEHLRDFRKAIESFLRAVGVLSGEPERQNSYRIVSNGSFLHNREGGMFIPACKVGDFVAKGQVMGRIVDLFGNTLEEIVSPHDDAFVAALRCNCFPTHAGEIVGEAVPLQSIEMG